MVFVQTLSWSYQISITRASIYIFITSGFISTITFNSEYFKIQQQPITNSLFEITNTTVPILSLVTLIFKRSTWYLFNVTIDLSWVWLWTAHMTELTDIGSGALFHDVTNLLNWRKSISWNLCVCCREELRYEVCTYFSLSVNIYRHLPPPLQGWWYKFSK